MTEKEMLIQKIEEFSRLQDYMLAAEKETNVYKLMLTRYRDLKAILTGIGVNLEDIDRVKA